MIYVQLAQKCVSVLFDNRQRGLNLKKVHIRRDNCALPKMANLTNQLVCARITQNFLYPPVNDRDGIAFLVQGLVLALALVLVLVPSVPVPVLVPVPVRTGTGTSHENLQRSFFDTAIDPIRSPKRSHAALLLVHSLLRHPIRPNQAVEML